MCNKCVGRSLVFVLNHRKYVHQTGMGARFVGHQLNESNHNVPEKSPKIDAAIKKRGGIIANPFESHPIMWEAPSLADRALIVDRTDSSKEGFIARNFAQHHTFFFSLTIAIPVKSTYLVFPPVFKCRDRQACKIVPLHGIR